MSELSFGLSMALLGMGGTLASLWIIILVMNVLKKVLPYRKSEGRE